MVRAGLILLLAVLVGACASDPFRAGRPAASPPGWADYCTRHPADRDCKTEEH